MPDTVDAGQRLAAWLEEAEIFHGETAPPLCRLYVRLPEPASEGVDLAGAVVGPRCLYSQTLEAHYPWKFRRGPGGFVGEALIPDPCCWTPQLPFLYEATLEAKSADGASAEHHRTISIRLLAAARRSLFLDRKRWVFRAVCRDHFPTESIDQWRRVEASLLVRNPDESTCESASRFGVLIGAIVDSPEPASIDRELRRLSRWPAVGLAFLQSPAARPIAAESASAAAAPRNLLLGAIARPGEWTEPSVAAPTLLCWSDQLGAVLANPDANSDRPIIALRRSRLPKSLEQARADCDRLQRDLAAVGDFAGYAV